MTQLHLQNAIETKSAVRRPVLEKPRVPVIAILIVIILGLNSAFGDRLNTRAQQILAKVAEQRNPRIASLEGNEPVQDRAEDHRHLMDLVKQLRKQARFPKDLDSGGSNERALWLESVKNQGESVAIEGMATTPTAVTTMISDLQSTGLFTNIEIKETYQDDSRNPAHAFKFQLSCEVNTGKS